ncbi:basic amino acid ABC transporter substrate-binding protein [Lachnospiraceae bacterium OttesenSCG-928-E19]|nr:basic amino acid ABC transporter substrate-binding protein [Lachnospiraceae bacterium OttesenSCG-928-E19]
MKKIVSVLMVMALAGMVLVGCGSKDSKDSKDSESEKDVLIMGTNAEFPPYEYYENDEIVGIDAEFAAAIAEKLGMELKIEDMAFDSIIAAVQSGKIDFGAAGMTVTPEREENVDFTDSYYTGRQVIIVADTNTEIQGPEQLEGKKIGVQQGTTGDLYASDEYGDENMERYSKGMEAVQALSQGKIDAVIIDDQPAQTFVEENEGLMILETEYVEEEYAMCFKKGNEELVKKVNDAIKELKEDGTFDEIVSKYIK